MPNIIYALDNAVESFFSGAGASASRIQGDDAVRRRYEGQIQPLNIQGSTSYTMTTGLSGNKLIQFREQTDFLEINILALAKDIHGDFIPS